MKLDIIVPHYKEPWSTCKYLFDSIAMQRGVPWTNVEVIVVNDGDCMLDKEVFADYPYAVHYLAKEHGGVSAARNYGLDHSTADYVMWCDIDDGFLNNYALHLIFSAMQEEPDFIICNFVEETYTDNGQITIVRHDKDLTFMHGKVYRRRFLVDNDLRFDPTMTIHEDGYFNNLVYAVTKHCGKQKTIDTPLYLWRWNDESTVRKDKKDFVLRTYEDVMLTRTGICDQLKLRGYDEDLKEAVVMTVMNSYYDFQKGSYTKVENARYKKIAEKAFRRFWIKYKKVFFDCSNILIAQIARVARENACNNGMLIEAQDIRTWLKHIEHEVKE